MISRERLKVLDPRHDAGRIDAIDSVEVKHDVCVDVAKQRGQVGVLIDHPREMDAQRGRFTTNYIHL
jgi:hypothetical protein